MPAQPRPIGHILDALGVTARISEGDLVEDAVVLLHVHRADGTRTVVAAQSTGLGWVTALGILTAAQRQRAGRLGTTEP